MYIAMNRFKVTKGAESAFEHVWLSRDSHLERVPGFLEFHLLRGPERDDHVLYASHTVWASKAAFTAWTQSEHFRAAHRDAGGNKPLYLGHPDSRASRQSRRSRIRMRGIRPPERRRSLRNQRVVSGGSVGPTPFSLAARFCAAFARTKAGLSQRRR